MFIISISKSNWFHFFSFVINSSYLSNEYFIKDLPEHSVIF